jgi:hypothetical protein
LITGRLPFENANDKDEINLYSPTSKQLETEGIPESISECLAHAMSNRKGEYYEEAIDFFHALNKEYVKVMNIDRVESGISEVPYDGNGYDKYEFEVEFKEAFKSAPIVQLSIGKIDSDTGEDATLRVDCRASDINANGFKIKVATWEKNKLHGLRVQWLAIGK